MESKSDAAEISFAESRVSEIAFVTPAKAPELMAAFSKACFTLGRVVSRMHYEHRLARKALDNRAAVMLVDLIPDLMKAKDLRDNEQNRQAFLDLDDEYNKAWLHEAQTEAQLILFERKLRDMEGALNAVKKAVGDQYGIFSRANPNLSTGGAYGTGTPDKVEVGISWQGEGVRGTPNVTGTSILAIGKPTL